MVIERGGRLCRCGNRGCVEAYIGADAMLSEWKDAGGVFEGTGRRAVGALIAAAPAATRRHSLPRPGGQFTLRVAKFGGASVATGSALLPLEALIATDAMAEKTAR